MNKNNAELLTSFANENYEKTAIEMTEATEASEPAAAKKPDFNRSSSVLKMQSLREKTTTIMCGLVHVNSIKYERFSQTLRMIYPFLILIVLILLLLFVFRINIFV